MSSIGLVSMSPASKSEIFLSISFWMFGLRKRPAIFGAGSRFIMSAIWFSPLEYIFSFCFCNVSQLTSSSIPFSFNFSLRIFSQRLRVSCKKNLSSNLGFFLYPPVGSLFLFVEYRLKKSSGVLISLSFSIVLSLNMMCAWMFVMSLSCCAGFSWMA